MIKVVQTGNPLEDVRRLAHSVNFSEAILAFPAVGSVEAFTTAAPTLVVNSFGGVAVDRSVFRRLLPDARWAIYAAGYLETNDGSNATVGLAYQTDAGALVSLGTVTVSTPGGKFALGPFDLFGTGGVPNTETVPIIRLTAQKAAGVNGEIMASCVWVRYLPSKQ